MYTTNFLDRTALSQAVLGTLTQDLGLKGVEYNTLTSILFIVNTDLCPLSEVWRLGLTCLFRATSFFSCLQICC
jgi:hypothetical protein